MINQKQIVSISFFALLIFVLYQIWLMFAPFFEAFFWASILTFAFYPLHQGLLKRLGHPTLSALIAAVGVSTIVILPSLFLLQELVDQTVSLYNFVKGGGLEEFIRLLKETPALQTIYARVSEYEPITRNLENLSAKISVNLTNFTAEKLAATTKNLIFVVVNFFLVAFLLFFLFRDGKTIYQRVYDLVPLESTDKEVIFGKINDTFASVIRGQFVTSVVQGLIGGTAYFALGIPNPAFFGFLTFLATFVPFFGTTVIWLPLAVYLLITQKLVSGIILFAVGVFGISLIDNIVKPVIIGERMKIPVFVLFFAVLGGLRVYGMMGVFMGPLFVTLFFALAKIYQERYGKS